jgi:zinc transport system substrate-binding protein
MGALSTLRPIQATKTQKFLLILISFLLTGILPGCAGKPSQKEGIAYIATIPPLAMIIREIVGDRGTVTSLLQPGSSPHTYEPKPSDVMTVESADCFFYVSPALDGWAASFRNERTIEVFEMVPEEMRRSYGENAIGEEENQASHDDEHHGIDPHFWTDPLTVKAILPQLADILSGIDPPGADTYRGNSDRFSTELDNLNDEVAGMLEPFRGEAVILMHPSFCYYLDRYGLVFAGAVEMSAGSEPSPAYIADLLQVINRYNIKSLFTEPQLPRSPVDMLSEETGLPVFTLDPTGGYEGRDNYRDLILYNTNVFVTAFSAR